MVVFESPRPLQWGALDVPLLAIGKDWNRRDLENPAGYSLVQDGERLWFVASHTRPAVLHPASRPGRFQAELWKYDVAELFLANPKTGHYLELNLGPNGAWWSCEFLSPRVRAHAEDVPLPGVGAFAELGADGSWVAAMAVPLEVLESVLGYDSETRGNVTFILNSPEQQFLTANHLSDGEPDYHLPAVFPALRHLPLPPQ